MLPAKATLQDEFHLLRSWGPRGALLGGLTWGGYDIWVLLCWLWELHTTACAACRLTHLVHITRHGPFVAQWGGAVRGAPLITGRRDVLVDQHICRRLPPFFGRQQECSDIRARSHPKYVFWVGAWAAFNWFFLKEHAHI